MKDPYAVLYQKEQELARVRNEIQALLTIIPLLEENAPAWADFKNQILSSLHLEHSSENSLADLERYFPFVRRLRTAP